MELADSPELEVVATDLSDELVRELADEERAVLDLSLQGYPVREVGERVGEVSRAVIRIRQELQRKMEAVMKSGEESEPSP